MSLDDLKRNHQNMAYQNLDMKIRMVQTALEEVLSHVVNEHPLPWTIDHDWSMEVHASDGHIVGKFMLSKEAQEIIDLAEKIGRCEHGKQISETCHKCVEEMSMGRNVKIVEGGTIEIDPNKKITGMSLDACYGITHYKEKDGTRHKVSKQTTGYCIYRQVGFKGGNNHIPEAFIMTEEEFNEYTKYWELIDEECT